MKDRQSIRKRGHDYTAPGRYFVTICTRNREFLLGRLEGQQMALSGYGKIVTMEWCNLPRRFSNVALEEFTVMPNHVHGIIIVVGAGLAPARTVDLPTGGDCRDLDSTLCGRADVWAGASPAPTLGHIIGAFKSLADRRCRQMFLAIHPGHRFGHLWQRNFHDHEIGDREELDRIREYIRTNVQVLRRQIHF